MQQPLDNYNNVVEACRALIDNHRWSEFSLRSLLTSAVAASLLTASVFSLAGLAHGRVTVSTVGIVDKIRRLSVDLPQVSLALSLHAPNQAMRSAIVPTAKNFPIEKLIDALDEHMMAHARRHKMAAAKRNGTNVVEYTVDERVKESTRRRAMIEYVMLDGETSSLEAAHQLGKLCEGRQFIVNLIPYNKTDVKDNLACPSFERMEEFRSIVASYGTFCTLRRTMGADIGSACGQLVTLEAPSSTSRGDSVRDIEDVAVSLLHEKEGSKAKGLSITRQNVEFDEQVGNDRDDGLELDKYILPLSLVTALAALSFIVSSALFIKQRRR